MRPQKLADILQQEDREIHLWYGGPDAGKSTRVLEVAALHPDKRMVIIDGECRLGKLWRNEWPFVENIEYYPVHDWKETKEAFDKGSKGLKFGDFLVMEMMDIYWDMAQNHWLLERYGETYEEWILRIKTEEDAKTGKRGDPNSLSMWQVVKAMHNMAFRDAATSFLECHVIMTAPAQPVLIGVDGKEVTDLFETVKFKSEGEKRNPYKVDTCIFFEINYAGGSPKRTWSTIKDKGERRRAWREPYDGKVKPWWTAYQEFIKSPLSTQEVKA